LPASPENGKGADAEEMKLNEKYLIHQVEARMSLVYSFEAIA
jgi:hypothetical protein